MYVASAETVAPVAASVPLTRKVTVYVPAALNAQFACVCVPAASGLASGSPSPLFYRTVGVPSDGV